MKNVVITEYFLNDLIDTTSRTTVGKILKRVDIFDDKETLKKALKEVIYEEYRNVRALLEAHSNGLLSTTLIEFKRDQPNVC